MDLGKKNIMFNLCKLTCISPQLYKNICNIYIITKRNKIADIAVHFSGFIFFVLVVFTSYIMNIFYVLVVENGKETKNMLRIFVNLILLLSKLSIFITR